MRLTDELGSCRKALEVKNRELSMALASFSEFQTKAEQRENDIRKTIAKDDDRVHALEEDKVELVAQLAELKTELATGDTQLDNVKETLSETKAELASLKEEVADSKSAGSKTAELLAIETSLRKRAEVKEEEERRERIAACAQLLAIEQ